MGIIAYQKEVSPGVHKTLYMVVAEAINRYTGRRVQKKRRGILSKPRAEILFRELWAECRERKPDNTNITLWDELIDHYLVHLESKVRSTANPNGFSPQVIRSKKSRLNHVVGWAKTHIDLITPQFVTDRLDEMEAKDASRSLTNHIQKEVKCVFAYAFALGAVKVNRFAGMKMRRMPKKRKEALNHEEVAKLLSEAHLRSHPYYHIWLLTIALGLRRSELAGLKWIDVDFDQRLIYLRRQKIPGEGIVDFLKDREERVVAIPQHIISALRELKLRTTSEFVINIQCAHWNDGGQAQVLRAFCREIGIKEVTHHQLRATHITLALVDGVPLGIVKENVGHAKLSTTDEYFRSAGISMRGQMDGLKIKVPMTDTAEVVKLNKIK